MRPFLAYVMPVSDGRPDQGLPGIPGYPDQGLPGQPGVWPNPPGGGVRPDQGLPGGWGGGHPSPPIYHPGHPDHGLPSQPGHPDQGLPGGGHISGQPIYPGGHPGNRPPGSFPGLPSHPIYNPPSGTKPPAPGSSPGAGLWVVAYVPGKGFNWVSVTPGVPEKPQPKPPGGQVDNTLPTVPVDPEAPPTTPDQGLPPTAAPKA